MVKLISHLCDLIFKLDIGPRSEVYVEAIRHWTLDVECKLKDKPEALRYSCRQFPGPVVPGNAQYKITNGRVVIKLPKADPSQSWAGELTVKGLDQSS
ncbi:unnamed protein product [Rodentolepis nana]|uniref:CS domain-containing protein n=1 Tax=Rodentolepis nana TaxID=102285 RepID=A0A0R3TGY8_RODNA|nr:unnamed protein product [Rodentolepis nana]